MLKITNYAVALELGKTGYLRLQVEGYVPSKWFPVSIPEIAAATRILTLPNPQYDPNRKVIFYSNVQEIGVTPLSESSELDEFNDILGQRG